jgi:hypothetical protein
VKSAVTTSLSLIALIAVIAAAGFPFYVAPPEESISEADLIYVLGSPVRERVDAERRLRADGVADRSLVSVGLTGWYTDEKLPVCREPQVDCVHPMPFTTKGEIAYLGRYAEEHHIARTVIVTFTPGVLRTRYIVDKCFGGDAVVVGIDQHLDFGDWVHQYAYQTLAFLKAWLTPCADASDQ